MLLDRTFDLDLQPAARANLEVGSIRAVEQFIFHEARMLDERSYDAWLALWTEEGRYWMPRHHNQANPFEQISLFYEDRMLRETRVKRLLNPRNWSQQPVTRSSRLVGNVQVEGLDSQGRLIVRSVIHYTEHRLEQRHLAGQVFHKLESTSEGCWRIYLKRIDLVNCDSVFANLEVFV